MLDATFRTTEDLQEGAIGPVVGDVILKTGMEEPV